jgi:ATPase family associated with various cellular activities (AAA)
MLPTSKLTESETPPLAEKPVPLAKVDRPFASTHVVCDLAECDAFSPGYKGMHVPVVVAFGGGPLHECRMHGFFDLDRALSENSAALFRSVRRLDEDRKLSQWDDLTFQFGPRSFLYADETRVMSYAETSQEAERLVTKFSECYRKPPTPRGGCFYLIRTGREISRELVLLGTETILTDEVFSLHYGQGSWEWHQDFIAKLRRSSHGLSIFEGSPGTGKTSYLRHLMGVLKDTHRFYFIPTATMGVLSNPDFIGFWAEQRRRYDDRQFVVILEDSAAALMTRGADNRDQVSAILNLSDGMLADFLRLQIICTINCKAADIDQALLRPGRLLCHRVFPRLDYAQASLLAKNLGKTLPKFSDYSLAEIFAGHASTSVNRPQIGFDA